MSTDLDTAPAPERPQVACPMCGSRYDPAENAACRGCPLNSGCALSCCPGCGYSSADPSQSLLLRGLQKLRRG